MTIEDKLETVANEEQGASKTNSESVKLVLSEYLRGGKSTQGAAEFVNRLAELVEIVNGLQAPRQLYKLNGKMENDVHNSLKEMEFLAKETRAVLSNIARLKKNKVNIKKEMSSMRESLGKRSKEQIQEMETIVAIYDKDLLKKWHIAKKTSSPHSLENFINNLAGKKEAIDHVYKMALDRLATLKKCQTEGNDRPTQFQLKFTGPILTAFSHLDTDTDSDGQFSVC